MDRLDLHWNSHSRLVVEEPFECPSYMARRAADLGTRCQRVDALTDKPTRTKLGIDPDGYRLVGPDSIALFIGGLFGGLRAYRMIGLLGLITCIARMFAVDIDDTFYRLIAFAVVALVLLGVGFLYTRFRRWIESQDEVA